MFKSELLEMIALDTGLNREKANDVLGALLKCIEKELAAGGKISLPGLGSFSLVERKARTGRNPRTGESISIPARKTVKFKPGKQLNEAVN